MGVGDFANIITAIGTTALAWIAWQARNTWIREQDRIYRREQGTKLLETLDRFLYTKAFVCHDVEIDNLEIDDQIYRKFFEEQISLILHIHFVFKLMKWPLDRYESIKQSIDQEFKLAFEPNNGERNSKNLRRDITRIAEILILDEKGHKTAPEPRKT